VRMSRIAGRTDDLIILQGAKVFPSQIQEVLLVVLGVKMEYMIVLDRKDDSDSMELHVAIPDAAGLDEIRTVERLRKDITSKIQTAFDIEAKVTFVETGSLPHKTGSKHKPVVDKRK
jgi:phenylacetate-CoA ligase